MFGTKTGNVDNFQERADISNAFELSYYETLGHYLTHVGVHPFQDEKESVVRLTLLVTFWITGITPMYITIWETIRKKDYDRMFEDSPQALTALISLVKLLNVYSNRSRFQYLFNYIIRGRKLMKTDIERRVLNDITKNGTVLADIYRRCLLLAMTLFILLPLFNPIMDILAPLNETRPRQHLFHVNYVFMDEMEHFFSVFVHLGVVAVVTVWFIISIDSLYIIIIHHACGMFAACGYIVQNVTEEIKDEKNFTGTYEFEEYNRCVIVHYEALQFYDVLNSCCRNSYLIQMGLNMVIVSTTAVQGC
ncbi:uncharacterized protein LOC113464945 [Ceratina calcarata]|uniref:Uncharacterized protein LOC113464945 n=1 Tax=Ceratina calcarata TaxID=156304 RepID=A0AAJ7S8Z1_9HYME|nr:uncharacterized protein LOC113464945 [Ceratina calcarata]